MVLVAALAIFVGCAREPEKETVYVPVPVQEADDPIQEQREQQATAEQVCEDLGGTVNYAGACELPTEEAEQGWEPADPAYVDEPCRLSTYRQLHPDECATYEPDFP